MFPPLLGPAFERGLPMRELTALNLTNIALGVATLCLWAMVLTGLVQEVRDRRRRRTGQEKHPHLRLLPPPPSKAA